MSVPFKIVYLVKDGESGENLIQLDELLELNAIDGAKIIDNSIPSAKLNIIDGEKIADNSISSNKLINNTSIVYQIDNIPSENLKIGMPVYWNGEDFTPANANISNKVPTAIIKDIQEDKYFVQFSGTFTTSNTNWNLITGETGGLSIAEGENIYYLSNSDDGNITNISPTFSVPIYNCIKNDDTNSTVEIKFGILTNNLNNSSFSQEREVFIGDAVENTFTLTKTPYSRNTTMVTIDGMVLQNDAFSISDKDIIFANIPSDESEKLL